MTQTDPTTDRLPMPPAEFLAAVTMVGERAAAGYGWQEGYLAGRTAAADAIRADMAGRTADDYLAGMAAALLLAEGVAVGEACGRTAAPAPGPHGLCTTCWVCRGTEPTGGESA